MSIKSLIIKIYLYLARHRSVSANSKLSHSIVIPHATYSPWIDDTNFSGAFEKIRENTLVDIYRAYELWSLVQETSNLNGDILEVGVWRGGTGMPYGGKSQTAEIKRNRVSLRYLQGSRQGKRPRFALPRR